MAREAWEAFIAADLNRLWTIQDWVYRHPWLDSRMLIIVSKHPWRDICMVPWLVWAVGVYDIGFRHFWIVAVNLVGVFLLRQAIQGKRPVEYDVRLQPMTDLYVDSFGLPSLETHMSVVILVHFSLYTAPMFTMLPAVLLALLVGFSRVYARSRFPHQVALSLISGVVGLLLGRICCERMSFHNMHWYHHNICLTVIGLTVAAAFAMAVENNDSRLAYIPKEEFMRVLVGIINSSSERPTDLRAEFQPDSDDPTTAQEEAFMDARMGNINGTTTMTPRAAAARRAKLSAPLHSGRRQKRDSFHFMQKQLEDRERKLRSGTSLDPLFLATPRSLAADSDAEHIA